MEHHQGEGLSRRLVSEGPQLRCQSTQLLLLTSRPQSMRPAVQPRVMAMMGIAVAPAVSAQAVSTIRPAVMAETRPLLPGLLVMGRCACLSFLLQQHTGVFIAESNQIW